MFGICWKNTEQKKNKTCRLNFYHLSTMFCSLYYLVEDIFIYFLYFIYTIPNKYIKKNTSTGICLIDSSFDTFLCTPFHRILKRGKKLYWNKNLYFTTNNKTETLDKSTKHLYIL